MDGNSKLATLLFGAKPNSAGASLACGGKEPFFNPLTQKSCHNGFASWGGHSRGSQWSLQGSLCPTYRFNRQMWRPLLRQLFTVVHCSSGRTLLVAPRNTTSSKKLLITRASLRTEQEASYCSSSWMLLEFVRFTGRQLPNVTHDRCRRRFGVQAAAERPRGAAAQAGWHELRRGRLCAEPEPPMGRGDAVG